MGTAKTQILINQEVARDLWEQQCRAKDFIVKEII